MKPSRDISSAFASITFPSIYQLINPLSKSNPLTQVLSARCIPHPSVILLNYTQPLRTGKMVQINDVKADARQNRTAAHSHIKGLGLRSDGYADKVSGGFVGQAAAREVSITA